MVSTRNHKAAYPEPTLSPTKQRSATPSSLPADITSTLQRPIPPRARSSAASEAGSSHYAVWAHTPSNLLLIWLAVSTPLVIWDCGYVLGRPYTFPGGPLHWPIYVPYALYEQVDYVYSVKAYNDRYGFSAAQSILNVVEIAGYLVYLWIVWSYGEQEDRQGAGAPSTEKVGFFGLARTVRGRPAGIACLLGLTVTVMTCSKTVLYWLIEACSGFDGVGHNDWLSLIFLWIIPNGPWIPLPGYLAYVFAGEVLEGLDVAAGEVVRGSNTATGETRKSQ